MSTPYTSPDLERDIHNETAVIVREQTVMAALRTSIKQKQSAKKGNKNRDWETEPLGYAAGATSVRGSKNELWAGDTKLEIVPFKDIPDDIRDREAKGITNRQILAQLGIKTWRSQYQTDLCWAFAPTFAMEAQYALSGRGSIEYSPHSLACWITGFQNRGGWTTKFVDMASRFGICTSNEWGRTFSRSRDTVENREAALARRWLEHYDIQTRSGGRYMSDKRRAEISYAVMRNLGPFAMGADWMRHAVCHIDMILVKDELVYFSANSGYLRNRKGYTLFSIEKGAPDSAVCPTVGRVGMSA